MIQVCHEPLQCFSSTDRCPAPAMALELGLDAALTRLCTERIFSRVPSEWTPVMHNNMPMLSAKPSTIRHMTWLSR